VQTDYPFYVYEAVKIQFKDDRINQATNLSDLARQLNQKADKKFTPFVQYQAAFENWANSTKVTPRHQQLVWAEFTKHTKPKDAKKLTPENLVKTFKAILHNIQHPKERVTIDAGLPLWVGANYSGGSSTTGGSSSFGSGGGFGGGASGGGGFSGGW
jgi:uncharacterized membrane protein YgcG